MLKLLVGKSSWKNLSEVGKFPFKLESTEWSKKFSFEIGKF